MLSIKLTTIALLISAFSFSQNAKSNEDSKSSMADVAVSVTDMQGRGNHGEVVVFRAGKSKKSFLAVTGKDGKCKIQLPIGADYTVTLKSLSDSTSYGILSIPALEADQFYTEPFNVNIQFEPARTYTLNNVQFDFGKATIKRESLPQLQELILFLKNKEGKRIEISGHTDNVGKPADNLKLSQERSATIVKYLISKGIAASRLEAKGYGDTKPIADNSTDEGRRLNRRTEVVILN